ncbi:MAG TPA: RNA polymerase factor sigma-32 [Candidatus Binataceae bacterium]|nr:RNA polymerase factor sigma-32 [Candidatus Binataceae bacterium]
MARKAGGKRGVSPPIAKKPRRRAQAAIRNVRDEVIETLAVPVEVVEDVASGSAPAIPFDHDTEEVAESAVAESRLPGLDDDDTGVAGADEGADGAQEDPDSAIIPYDPLGRYLSEIRRFPLLSREEEVIIGQRYAEHHDPADAYRLVTANLRLVVKIANEFSRASRNLLDLIQEGNVGLMEAVKNFDPYRGIRFPSYAVWWVRAYIYRYLINNWRLVKIGTTQAQRKLFFNLRKETERLETEGFTPQPKLIAQRMGVKESEVREMQERMGQNEVSLDQPATPGDETSLMDLLPAAELNPEERTARAEWRKFAHEQVEEFAATLSDKEREIFAARLMTEDPPTLQEVGARFGVSRERVRQIEARLKVRLREFIQERAGDIDHAES